MILIVYRATVWICIDHPYIAGATLPSMPTASLIEALTHAATHTYGDTQS